MLHAHCPLSSERHVSFCKVTCHRQEICWKILNYNWLALRKNFNCSRKNGRETVKDKTRICDKDVKYREIEKRTASGCWGNSSLKKKTIPTGTQLDMNYSLTRPFPACQPAVRHEGFHILKNVHPDSSAFFPPFPAPLCSRYVMSPIDAWLPGWLTGWLAALQIATLLCVWHTYAELNGRQGDRLARFVDCGFNQLYSLITYAYHPIMKQ